MKNQYSDEENDIEGELDNVEDSPSHNNSTTTATATGGENGSGGKSSSKKRPKNDKDDDDEHPEEYKDSSEEEEEGEDAYQYDDFVVPEDDDGDDDAGDNDDGEDDDDDDQEDEETLKRREERRKRREERHKRREEKKKRQEQGRLHRLKKFKAGDDSEDLREKLQQSLFGNDDILDEETNENGYERERDDDYMDRDDDFDSEDEMDGFVVDSHDKPVNLKNKNRRGRVRQYEEEDMLLEERPKDTLSLIKEQYEPSLLEEKHFTDADEEIRKKNVPERLQLRKGTPYAGERQTYEEAEWIYESAFDNKEAKDLRMIETISTILKFFQRDMLEVPFVYTYKKDVFEPMTLQDLWTIFDLDEKWNHMMTSKKSLESFIAANPNLEQYQQSLRECKSEEGIADLYDLFQMINGPEGFRVKSTTTTTTTTVVDDENNNNNTAATTAIASTPKLKRAIKRDLYTVYSKAGLTKFLPYYGISAQEFGINLMDNYMSHVPNDHFDDPSSCAMKHICVECGNIDSVLRAARYLMAHDIGFDPNVRQSIRMIYRKYAYLTTTPTAVGQKEIDAFHPYITVKSIREKPCHIFDDTQYLLILKAEREGFVKTSIGIPEHVHDNVIIPEMEALYLSSGTSSNAQQWNAERKQIIRDTLNMFLYPVFEKELRNKLLTEASNRVAFECAMKLEEKLRVAPWQPNQQNDDDEEEDEAKTFNIMSFCWGSEKVPTMCAVLNSDSELLTQTKMDFLCDRVGDSTLKNKKQDDVSKLTNLLTDYKPRLILISATEMESKRLFDEIRDHVTRLHSDGVLKLSTEIYFASPEIGLSLQNSQRYFEEFPEFPSVLKHAVAVARCALDPLSEYSNLCTDNKEVLYLKLHPLQEMIGKDYLLKLLYRCFINVVNAVGVDINKYVKNKFAASPLQFVSGLGSRKAQALLNAVFRKGGYVSSRQSIEKILTSQDVNINPLDDTRIHPDDYLSAYKIAADALDRTVDQDSLNEDVMNDCVFEVMNDPKKLESIDLDAFAELLEIRQNTQKKKLLYAIKNELTSPFADIRNYFQPPSPSQIFSWLTGETDQTLRIGTLVSVTTYKNLDGVKCRLENGLEGTIPTECISETNDVKSLPRGQTLNCRILSIEKERFHVTLSCKPSDLAAEKWEDIIYNELKYNGENTYLILGEAPKAPIAANTKKRQSVPQKIKKQKRTVVHPLWHSFTWSEAENHLKDRPVGEALLRPSSRGFDHITVTFKFSDNVIIHHDIKEKDKPNPVSLGLSFYIGEAKYDSLDEILGRHVEYIINNVNNLKEHKYYRSGTKSEVEEKLRKDKQRFPKSIPYAFAICEEKPGYVYLYHVPNQNPRYEYVLVKEDGYEIRGKTFGTVDELIHYFKKNYQQILKTPLSGNSSSSSSSSSSGTNNSNQRLPTNSSNQSSSSSSASSASQQQQQSQHQQQQSYSQPKPQQPVYQPPVQPAYSSQPPQQVYSQQPFQQQQQQRPPQQYQPQAPQQYQQPYQAQQQQYQQPLNQQQQQPPQNWRAPPQQGMYQQPPPSQYDRRRQDQYQETRPPPPQYNYGPSGYDNRDYRQPPPQPYQQPPPQQGYPQQQQPPPYQQYGRPNQQWDDHQSQWD
ncbi:SH2 domain-containing protein [Heterostelium album PN500]|uniref:SH2 domain-containing protein n=1 Tax=Heterostelium pallidum (strain ATCC 26659 / Pp 5 / PN500) TaxID=670386 RepID=D3BVL2_HETP5|nr:SH2 domain-containing protein [Heterostelium album PN500]EFA74515.1 SH2 domain-containing protein [Heterostelium album PN500]|eukprot:XP_020426649.1 SH2 domain-containing protein [Heterostelium album PN500]